MTRLPVFVALSMLAFGCGKAVPTSEGGRATTPAPGRNAQRDESGGRADPFPPDDWTHKELAEHLKGKGVAVEVAHWGIYDKPGRPAAGFRDGKNGIVLVYLCADRKTAREVAGSMGEGALDFGRFAIGNADTANTDNANLLNRIKTTLR